MRAAKVAGLATVPVVLRETDDADLLREALIENIHWQDLGPIELAEAFRQLLDDLGLKQEELADRVGVSRSHIANTIRLLQLPLETQQLLTDQKIQAGHARALLALGEADAVNTLALRVAAEDLSVRETEDLIRRYLEPPPRSPGRVRGCDRSPPTPEWPRSKRSCRSSRDAGSDPVREEAGEGDHRVRLRRRPGAHRVRDRSGPGLAPD